MQAAVPRAAKHAFGEWTTVVSTRCANGVETIVDACQQNPRLAGQELFHFSVAQVGDVCEVNFFRTHAVFQATLTRWPIFSFLVFR